MCAFSPLFVCRQAVLVYALARLGRGVWRVVVSPVAEKKVGVYINAVCHARLRVRCRVEGSKEGLGV